MGLSIVRTELKRGSGERSNTLKGTLLKGWVTFNEVMLLFTTSFWPGATHWWQYDISVENTGKYQHGIIPAEQ